MHDKTQIFPLPDDDVVHSRLTHSLEVASVGRSLGTSVGTTLATSGTDVCIHDLADVVAAACLAHDIGNPPFGHAGESAIASFFISELGQKALEGLSDREREDFGAFEGNAQGFRTLVRLQLEADGGLQLTAATLGAFSKYPRESGSDLKIADRCSTKKHGLFQDEVTIFDMVARETGLHQPPGNGGRRWTRHPLAFLVEAADDICYSILDIEDGVRLGLVPPKSAEEPLSEIAGKTDGFSVSRLDGFVEPKARIGYLRAVAIGQLVDQCANSFALNEDGLLAGVFDTSLSDVIPSRDALAALRALAKTYCYQAEQVLQIELAGYEALGGLLEFFVRALITESDARGRRPPHQEHFVKFLSAQGVQLAGKSRYHQLLSITDYVSGMTDRHALGTFRRLKGIAIPGRLG